LKNMAFTQTTAAVPDAELITQTLAKLQPDSALQNYARMHKNDPYIVSLANAESNRRKALRVAAQGQNGGQQPTVVDRSIDGMAPAPVMTGAGVPLQTGYGGPVMTGMASGGLPEDQGIAQLPTPNMQSMADGGIAGYDDEEGMATGGMGGMFNFAQQSEPVVRMAGGGHIPRYQGMPPAMGGDGSVVKSSIQQIEDANIAELSPLAQQFKTAEQQFIAAARSGDQAAIAQYMQVKEDLRKQLEQAVSSKFGNAAPKVLSQLLSSEKPAAPTAPVTPAFPASQKTPAVAPNASVSAAPAAPAPDVAAPKADVPPKTQSVKPQTSMGGAQGIKAMYEQFAGPENVRETELNEIRRLISEQGESETSAAQRQLNQLKADLAAQGTYGKDREAKLKGKEERIGKEEGQAGGLALLEAGLAMMAGGSSNAFANIGQGAMVGTAAYRKSMDKIADAKDKLDDAYGRLEDVRFNQTSMNNSEIRKATADVDKAANAGLKSLTDFAVTRYGMKRDDVKTMFTGAMQENVANIGARATMYSADKRSTDQKEMMESIRGGQLVETAMKNLREQINKSDKYGTQADKDAAFEKLWPQVLQMNPNLAKYAGTIGGGGAPAGGADFVLNAQTGKLEPRK
jgi:hypothetical protein